MSINVAQILHQAALRTPDRVAMTLVGGDDTRQSWTCGQLDRRARQVAARLAPGARVAVQFPNGPDFVAAWFGALYAGGTVLPIPLGLPEAAVAPRLAHADLLLADALDLADDAPALDGPRSTAGDAPAMILFTSGTTAKPRGVVIGHSALLLHTTTVVHRTLQLTDADVILGVLPFTHSFGCRMVMLAGLVAGARVVATQAFGARQSHALIVDEGVTWVPAVPTMFAAWAALPAATTAIRWCLSAGAPLADAVRVRAERALNAEIRQGYGMTEATFSTIDAPPNPQHPGSVGRPVWGVEVTLVDTVGDPVPIGVPGQILLRGPNQMLGYLDDPVATAATVKDGWIHSGDIGIRDADDTLAVVDRVKDIILRGGFTVYPSRVEAAVAAFEGIAEVAVVGRPDDFYGEEVVACIIVDSARPPDLEALDLYLRATLADSERPRQFEVFDNFPLGPSRKVLKRTLRDTVLARAKEPHATPRTLHQ